MGSSWSRGLDWRRFALRPPHRRVPRPLRAAMNLRSNTTEASLDQRLSMTTTTTTTLATAVGRHRLARLLWIGRPAPRGPAGVRCPPTSPGPPCGGLPGPALADRRHRHLHDLSPPADPPQLRDPAPVARIRPDGHRLLRLRRGADRLGGRSPESPRPLRRRARRPQPQPRLRLGPHVLVDDARYHLEPHARILQEWAPDLYKDPVHRWIDSYHFVFPILLFVALYAFGGMSWLVWGGFVRTIFVLHTTWLVNSATHIWGYRTHETRDSSTNLWWVALLTYGEGWHNNHHAFQTSARHGLRWWEVDMTYVAIRLMDALAWPTRSSCRRSARPSLPWCRARPRPWSRAASPTRSPSPSGPPTD